MKIGINLDHKIATVNWNGLCLDVYMYQDKRNGFV